MLEDLLPWIMARLAAEPTFADRVHFNGSVPANSPTPYITIQATPTTPIHANEALTALSKVKIKALARGPEAKTEDVLAWKKKIHQLLNRVGSQEAAGLAIRGSRNVGEIIEAVPERVAVIGATTDIPWLVAGGDYEFTFHPCPNEG
jgi:hypothetical protein